MQRKFTIGLVVVAVALAFWPHQHPDESVAPASAPKEPKPTLEKPRNENSGVVLKRPKKLRAPVQPMSPHDAQPQPSATNAGETEEHIDTGWVDPPPPHVVLPPGDPSWPKELNKSVREAMGKLRECATQWRQEVPDFKGRVTMGMLVGTEGLESTELIEFDDLPEALAGCISASLFEVSWPATEEGVVHVRYPFVFVPAEESEE